MGSDAVSPQESGQKATPECRGKDHKVLFLVLVPDFIQAGTTPVPGKENQPGS